MALQSNQTPETCQDALADCLEESERVLIMLNTLMDISEAETGSLKLELQPVDISILLENVVELYRYVAEDKNIVLCTQTTPRNFTQTLTPTECGRCWQIYSTMPSNTLPAEEGLMLRLLSDSSKSPFSSRIPELASPRKNCPKFGIDCTVAIRAVPSGDLGLGLSLVKAIVQAHGGSVEVSSQPGVGSLFAYLFPRRSDSQNDLP